MINLQRGFFVSALLSLLLGFSATALAAAQPLPEPQVMFNLNADQWVTSNSANVSVTVHAAIAQEQLADMQSNMLKNLSKIAPQGTWHITQINRKQSQANLEQLDIVAEARLPASSLTDLRSKAKAVSKSGEAYSITSIDYSPTDAELNKAQADLRQQIYQQAKQELARLNQLYPEQAYQLFTVNFNGTMIPQANYQFAAPRVMAMSTAKHKQAPSDSDAAQVSQHLRLTAAVILSARPTGSKSTDTRVR